MKRTTPTWAMMLSGAKIASGRMAFAKPGETRPRSDGPSMMPATTSPMTAGCRSRLKAQPSARDAIKITTRARRTRASRSEAWGAPVLTVAPCEAGASSAFPKRAMSAKAPMAAAIIAAYIATTTDLLGPVESTCVIRSLRSRRTAGLQSDRTAELSGTADAS
jgi:hypothetical protein